MVALGLPLLVTEARAQTGVGIGLTAPTQALDVNGGLLVRGYRAVSQQGAYLQWNRSSSEGETWLLNQKGGGTANAGIRFGSVTTADAVSEYARFLDNGYLGLGLPTPGQRLDVLGVGRFTADGPGLQLRGIGAGSQTYVEFYPNGPGSTRQAFLGFPNNGSTDLTLVNENTAGDFVAQAGRNLRFNVGSTNQVLVNATGVGIGTNSPGAALDVASTPYLAGRLSSANAAGTWLNLANTSTGGGGFQFISTGAGNGEGVNKLLIGTGTGGNLTSAALVVDGATGNVGLGTTSPTARLQVQGDALVQGTVTQTGQISTGFNGDGSYANPVTSVGQSFTLLTAATVTSVTIRNANPQNSTSVLSIFNGNGTSATYSQAVATSPGSTTYTLTTPQLLPAGEHRFEFARQPTNGVINPHGYSKDVYAGGTIYFDGQRGQTNFELEFTVAYTTSQAVPTLYAAIGGNVGIGTASPSYRLDVAGDINASGQLRTSGTVVTSDQRFKTDVRPLAGALAAVQALRGVRYHWNALGVQRGGAAGAEQVGFLAQELEKVYPELVSTGPDGYKAVNYAQLTPVLLEAIKELAARNAALEAQVRTLQADHATLETLQAQVARLLSEAPRASR